MFPSSSMDPTFSTAGPSIPVASSPTGWPSNYSIFMAARARCQELPASNRYFAGRVSTCVISVTKQASTKTLFTNQFIVQMVQSGACRNSTNLVTTIAISSTEITIASGIRYRGCVSNAQPNQMCATHQKSHITYVVSACSACIAHAKGITYLISSVQAANMNRKCAKNLFKRLPVASQHRVCMLQLECRWGKHPDMSVRCKSDKRSPVYPKPGNRRQQARNLRNRHHTCEP